MVLPYFMKTDPFNMQARDFTAACTGSTDIGNYQALTRAVEKCLAPAQSGWGSPSTPDIPKILEANRVRKRPFGVCEGDGDLRCS